MRKFFTIAILASMCGLIFTSCDKDNPINNGGEKETTFTITTESPMEFSAEGGTGVIDFTIENPIEGLQVSATTESSWIENISVAEIISFDVLVNENLEPRQGIIVISYNEANYQFTVNQLAAQEDPLPDPVINITSDNPASIPATGGECIITYTIENTIEGVEIEALSEQDWIVINDHSFDTDGQISVAVLENEANVERTAIVVVSYAEVEEEVVINQAAAQGNDPGIDPDVVELPYLSCLYFGNYYGATEDDYNYSIILATQPDCFDIVTGSVEILANSNYLFIDLYSAKPSSTYNTYIQLPSGEYTFDYNDSAVAGTFGNYYSYYVECSETSNTEDRFTAGTVLIDQNRIYVEVTMEDGSVRKFSCNNTYVDNSQNFGPDDFNTNHSILTEDLNIEFTAGLITGSNDGDYYVIGKDNWTVRLADRYHNHTITFDILTNPDQTSIVGSYIVSNDLSNEDMILPGYVDGYYGDTMWSWYRLYEDGSVYGGAPIVDGTVDIKDNGDGTITVDFNLKDDKGNTISGSCTGENEVLDFSNYSASAAPAVKKVREYVTLK